MPEEIDLRELQRRIQQLERRFEQVASQATQREEDWGTVRSQAGKVTVLLEEVHKLTRSVEQLTRRPGKIAPVAEQPTVPVDLEALAQLVMPQLKALVPTSEGVEELVKQGLTEAVRKLDLGGLAERVYKDIGTASVEEKLAKLLRDHVGVDVDTKAVVSAIADKLMKELDLDALKESIVAQIAERIAKRLELSTRRPY